MRARFVVAIGAAASVASAISIVAVARHDAWRATTLESIAASPDARRVRFARGTAAFEATVVRFPAASTEASFVDLADGKTLADAAANATVVVNGGYFDASFNPLGLHRVDGREVASLLARPPLSGVVTVDSAGRLDVVTRDDSSVSLRRRCRARRHSLFA